MGKALSCTQCGAPITEGCDRCAYCGTTYSGGDKCGKHGVVLIEVTRFGDDKPRKMCGKCEAVKARAVILPTHKPSEFDGAWESLRAGFVLVLLVAMAFTSHCQFSLHGVASPPTQIDFNQPLPYSSPSSR